MKKILIAVDGSDHSQSACDIGTALAKQHNSKILLTHVVTTKEPTDIARHAAEVEFSDELVKRSRSVASGDPAEDAVLMAQAIASHGNRISMAINAIFGEELLRRVLSSMQNNTELDVDTRLVDGEAADDILKIAEDEDVDTIIVGCRGMGSLKGLLLGSVSQSIAHRAHCSVIMVK